MRIKAQLPHNVELIDQTFLSILGREASLLRKCLDCILSTISQAFHLIDTGKVSLAKFFEWLEHLMESLLIDDLREAQDPSLNDISMTRVERKLVILILEQFQSQLLAKYIFLHKKRNTCCW